jgi:hypothetical protein
MSGCTWTAEHVVSRMQEAGSTMMALRVPGCWPASYKVAWPDVVRDFWEAYGQTDSGAVRVRPTASAIAEMDEAMAWLLFIPPNNIALRRIVWARSLLHPGHGGYLHSWRSIGRLVELDRTTVQHWHQRGVAMIVARLNRQPDMGGLTIKRVSVIFPVDVSAKNRLEKV